MVEQHVVAGDIAEAVPIGARLQRPGADLIVALTCSGCRALNHQSFRSGSAVRWPGQRKLRASSKISWISRRPAGPSIIAEATSSEAMMPYGEVEMCIAKASLKRATSSSGSAILRGSSGLAEGGEHLVRGVGSEHQGPSSLLAVLICSVPS